MNRMILRIIFYCFVGIGVLSACTRLETFQHAEVKGNEFQKALVGYYRDFAAQEAKQYDWVSSQHFINKGMLLVYGNDVLPEEISEWDIPHSMISEFTIAREQLMKLVNHPTLQKTSPQLLAKAIFSFDCWLEQQEENWQAEDIEACREGLFSAMHELSVSIEKPKAKAEAPSKEKNLTYRLFFKLNSAAITPEMQHVIQNIIKDIRATSFNEVVLNGYTDRAGSEEYNLELSKKRALAVKGKLIEGGVSETLISVFAFGEEDNATLTEDGIIEPSNRRVEIYITD